MKAKDLFLYFLIFVVIYINDDTFMFGTNENNAYIIIRFVIYCGLISILLLRNQKSYNKTTLIILSILILLVSLTAFINFDFTGGYIFQVIILILSFLLVKEIKFSTFSYLFLKFIYFFCLVSIIAIIFVLFVPSILNYFPVITNIGGVRSYNLYLTLISEGDGHSIPRNAGIFREPGVYMVYLNIAIIINLFWNEKVNNKYLLVYLLTVISTMSTAGVIISASLILLSLFKNRNNKLSHDKFFVAFFFISAIVYLVLNEAIFVKIFGKLESSSASYISTLSRISSLIIPIKIFFDSPLWGSGLSSFSSEFLNYSTAYFGIPFSTSVNATNTFTNKFATYGFLFGMIFIYSIFNFSKKVYAKRGKKISIILFLLFLAMFSNEDMRYSLLFNMLVFYGLFPLDEESLKIEYDTISCEEDYSLKK